MNTELLSILDIAKMIGVPQRTLYNYRKRFSAYIPVTNQGRECKYPHNAIQIFSDIYEYSKGGKSSKEIEALLQGISQDAIDSTWASFNESAASVEKDDAESWEFTGEIKEQLTALSLEIGAIHEQLRSTQEAIASLSTEVGQLSKMMLDQRDRELMGLLRNRKQHKWFAK